MALRATLAAAALASALAAASPLPHLMYLLVDDWGHADVGYHRPGFNETITPNIDALVKVGVELNQGYVHKYCSPTRSSVQSGRLPYHVNVLNDDMSIWNKQDPVAGFAGVPRNMASALTQNPLPARAHTRTHTHPYRKLRRHSCTLTP